MSVGTSTFQVTDSYTRNPLVDWSLSLSPAYSFPDSTRISASASISQELTLADSDDDPQTLLFSDVSLSVGRPLYRFENGPRLAGSLSLRLPTSTSSRVSSLMTSLGASLSAWQMFGKFSVNLGTGFRKNFHRYTHPVRDANTGRGLVTRDGLVIEEVVTGLARVGGSELAGATYFDGGTNNTSMIWTGNLGASYSPTDKINLGISYGLSSSWTYESFERDELSGVGARSGRGLRQSQTGTISGSYQALDNLSLGLGMVTGGGLMSADNKRFRFPFYAFEGADSNLTTFFVSATYTESIPL